MPPDEGATIKIRDKLSCYLSVLATRLKDARSGEGRPVASLSWERPLANIFAHAEETPFFHDLANACYCDPSFPKDRMVSSSPGVESWKEGLGTFFRTSGVYLELARGACPSPDQVLERLESELRKEACKITYLALLDGINLAKDDVEFGHFRLRFYDVNALKEEVGYGSKAIFYPHTLKHFSRLADHYFLVATEEAKPGIEAILLMSLDPVWDEMPTFDLPHKRGAKPNHEKEDMRFEPQWVPGFPREVEKGLTRLALYDWRPCAGRNERNNGVDDLRGWFAPRVAAIITLTDDLFQPPGSLPDAPGVSVPIVDNDGREIIEEPPEFILEEQETEDLAHALTEFDRAFSRLESVREAEFVRNAAGFLLKGFVSRGVEQVLWHVVALEAALGEHRKDESITGILRRRLGVILGDTEQSCKRIRKAFDDMYAWRSKVVHGTPPGARIPGRIFWQARFFARAATAWAIQAFAFLQEKARTPTLHPQRSSLLHLMDLTEAERIRLGAQMSWVPSSFPHVPEWVA